MQLGTTLLHPKRPRISRIMLLSVSRILRVRGYCRANEIVDKNLVDVKAEEN